MNKKFKSMIRKLLPRVIRPYRIMAGPLRGEKLVTSWYDYPGALIGSTERPLLAWFTKNVNSGETWLDVGAHYGYTALALCRLVGEQGHVFAFEPMLSTAGYVQQTRRINNLPQLMVVPVALGSPEVLAVEQLAITRGMLDSTILTGNWMETFFVARLDWLWPRICAQSPQIHGVKVDVQGMEIEVLRGMFDLLKLHKPKLVVELHMGVARPEFLALIEQLGYSRDALPIEPVVGETEAQFIDDRSYVFYAV